MRATTLIAAACLTAALTLPVGVGIAVAGGHDTKSAKTPDHAPVVAARQAGFKLTAATFGGLKAAIARGDDVKTLAFPATAVAAWGKAIPAMFPPGSTTPESGALPVVWTDRAGFETAAGNLAAAATKLADLAKAGDTAGFAAQYAEVGKTCGGCHEKYRKPPEKK